MLVLNLYNLVICSVAAMLYVGVDKVEPSRRDATVLKLAIVALAIAAILAHLAHNRKD